MSDEFDDARDRLREGAVRNGHHRIRQLSFDIAGVDKDAPEYGALKLSGTLPVYKDLQRQEYVQIRICNSLGEVLVETSAVVTSIHFKDETDKHGEITTERIHTAVVA